MTGRKRSIPNHPAQHSFAIVKFHLPGKAYQYDIAPIGWIKKSGNRNTCYWPGEDEARNGKQLIDLITKNAVVDKETWSVFTITIIAKFDTYKGAQDKLKNVLAGETVVSTDLEKRGKGGRSEAKKRKSAAAKSTCISVDTTASSNPVPGTSTGAYVSVTNDVAGSTVSTFAGEYFLPSSPSPTTEEALNDGWLNGASSDASFTGLPELLTSDDEHVVTKDKDNSVDALPSIPLAPAFQPLQRAIMPHLPYAKKSAPLAVPAGPMELSQTVPCDAKKLDEILQTNFRILRGQEQIKAAQTDMQNTLSVIMNNIIQPDSKQLGIKSDLNLPVKSQASFDRLNLTIRKK